MPQHRQLLQDLHRWVWEPIYCIRWSASSCSHHQQSSSSRVGWGKPIWCSKYEPSVAVECNWVRALGKLRLTLTHRQWSCSAKCLRGYHRANRTSRRETGALSAWCLTCWGVTSWVCTISSLLRASIHIWESSCERFVAKICSLFRIHESGV